MKDTVMKVGSEPQLEILADPEALARRVADWLANDQPFGPGNTPSRHVLSSLGLAVRSDRANGSQR
jgi:hypothetical protein